MVGDMVGPDPDGAKNQSFGLSEKRRVAGKVISGSGSGDDEEMPQDCKSYEGDERRTEGGRVEIKVRESKDNFTFRDRRRREGRGGYADSTREWKEEKTSARNTGRSAETGRLAWHGQQNHLLFDESHFMGRRWESRYRVAARTDSPYQ
jgi:hypothetical protein